MMNPCVSIDCVPSTTVSLERMRFFSRQLINADDLTQEQRYFRDRLRRHNRLLHGWGVVCGARVRPGQEAWTVTIEPGYVLDCHGNEILIDRDVTVDLRCEEARDPCSDIRDPWCSDVVVDRDLRRPLYIAVCYAECFTRPVRVHGNGCGCDTAECEYSRVRDSFTIKVLTEPPEGFPCEQPDVRQGYPFGCPPGGIRDCPLCCDDACVGLAKVTFRGGEGEVVVDNSCRRTAVTFANWWLCCSAEPGSTPTTSMMLVRSPEDVTTHTASFAVVSMSEPEEPGRETAPFLWQTPGGQRILFPLAIEVPTGASVAELLDAQGDETFFHPQAGGLFSLRNLFAAADLGLDETFEDPEALLNRLEDAPIDLANYLSTRTVLTELLNPQALEAFDEREGGHLAALAESVEARSIASITPDSPVERAVAGLTVASLAGLSRDSFVEQALRKVSQEERPQVEKEARRVWTRAQRIVKMTRGEGEGKPKAG